MEDLTFACGCVIIFCCLLVSLLRKNLKEEIDLDCCKLFHALIIDGKEELLYKLVRHAWRVCMLSPLYVITRWLSLVRVI